MWRFRRLPPRSLAGRTRQGMTITRLDSLVHRFARLLFRQSSHGGDPASLGKRVPSTGKSLATSSELSSPSPRDEVSHMPAAPPSGRTNRLGVLVDVMRENAATYLARMQQQGEGGLRRGWMDEKELDNVVMNCALDVVEKHGDDVSQVTMRAAVQRLMAVLQGRVDEAAQKGQDFVKLRSQDEMGSVTEPHMSPDDVAGMCYSMRKIQEVAKRARDAGVKPPDRDGPVTDEQRDAYATLMYDLQDGLFVPDGVQTRVGREKWGSDVVVDPGFREALSDYSLEGMDPDDPLTRQFEELNVEKAKEREDLIKFLDPKEVERAVNEMTEEAEEKQWDAQPQRTDFSSQVTQEPPGFIRGGRVALDDMSMARFPKFAKYARGSIGVSSVPQEDRPLHMKTAREEYVGFEPTRVSTALGANFELSCHMVPTTFLCTPTRGANTNGGYRIDLVHGTVEPSYQRYASDEMYGRFMRGAFRTRPDNVKNPLIEESRSFRKPFAGWVSGRDTRLVHGHVANNAGEDGIGLGDYVAFNEQIANEKRVLTRGFDKETAKLHLAFITNDRVPYTQREGDAFLRRVLQKWYNNLLPMVEKELEMCAAGKRGCNRQLYAPHLLQLDAVEITTWTLVTLIDGFREHNVQIFADAAAKLGSVLFDERRNEMLRRVSENVYQSTTDAHFRAAGRIYALTGEYDGREVPRSGMDPADVLGQAGAEDGTAVLAQEVAGSGVVGLSAGDAEVSLPAAHDAQDTVQPAIGEPDPEFADTYVPENLALVVPRQESASEAEWKRAYYRGGKQTTGVSEADLRQTGMGLRKFTKVQFAQSNDAHPGVFAEDVLNHPQSSEQEKLNFLKQLRGPLSRQTLAREASEEGPSAASQLPPASDTPPEHVLSFEEYRMANRAAMSLEMERELRRVRSVEWPMDARVAMGSRLMQLCGDACILTPEDLNNIRTMFEQRVTEKLRKRLDNIDTVGRGRYVSRVDADKTMGEQQQISEMQAAMDAALDDVEGVEGDDGSPDSSVHHDSKGPRVFGGGEPYKVNMEYVRAEAERVCADVRGVQDPSIDYDVAVLQMVARAKGCVLHPSLTELSLPAFSNVASVLDDAYLGHGQVMVAPNYESKVLAHAGIDWAEGTDRKRSQRKQVHNQVIPEIGVTHALRWKKQLEGWAQGQLIENLVVGSRGLASPPRIDHSVEVLKIPMLKHRLLSQLKMIQQSGKLRQSLLQMQQDAKTDPVQARLLQLLTGYTTPLLKEYEEDIRSKQYFSHFQFPKKRGRAKKADPAVELHHAVQGSFDSLGALQRSHERKVSDEKEALRGSEEQGLGSFLDTLQDSEDAGSGSFLDTLRAGEQGTGPVADAEMSDGDVELEFDWDTPSTPAHREPQPVEVEEEHGWELLDAHSRVVTPRVLKHRMEELAAILEAQIKIEQDLAEGRIARREARLEEQRANKGKHAKNRTNIATASALPSTQRRGNKDKETMSLTEAQLYLDDAALSEGLPAMVHSYSRQPHKHQRTGVFIAHPFLALVAEGRRSIAPKPLPMITPPRPWTSATDGGYMLMRHQLLRLSATTNAHVRAVMRADTSRLLEGLNYLASVPWSINDRVLAVVNQLWTEGGGICAMPRHDDRHVRQFEIGKGEGVVQDLIKKATGAEHREVLEEALEEGDLEKLEGVAKVIAQDEFMSEQEALQQFAALPTMDALYQDTEKVLDSLPFDDSVDKTVVRDHGHCANAADGDAVGSDCGEHKQPTHGEAVQEIEAEAWPVEGGAETEFSGDSSPQSSSNVDGGSEDVEDAYQAQRREKRMREKEGVLEGVEVSAEEMEDVMAGRVPGSGEPAASYDGPSGGPVAEEEGFDELSSALVNEDDQFSERKSVGRAETTSFYYDTKLKKTMRYNRPPERNQELDEEQLKGGLFANLPKDTGPKREFTEEERKTLLSQVEEYLRTGDKSALPQASPEEAKSMFTNQDGEYMGTTKDNMVNVSGQMREAAMWTDFFQEQQNMAKANTELHSLRCTFEYKLDVANKIKGRAVYFPYNCDFRGRVYPIPPHLTHTADDICRGLLRFHEKRPLGRRGLRWLKIHLATVYGEDKRSFDERVEWVDEHLPEIYDSADEPLHPNRHQWRMDEAFEEWEQAKLWSRGDDPFQTLAACIELAAAMRSPNPEQYECGLPVHQDGSCNGLQHYAALGRDEWGGGTVNLRKADRPQDVYSAVLQLVLRKIDQHIADDESEYQQLAMLLRPHVSRPVVKQTIMTSVYGVTMGGATNQIKAQLDDLEGIIWPEPKERAVRESSSYLATLAIEAQGEIFAGAQAIMDWLRYVATLIAKEGQPVSWITPLGLPVVQPYRNTPVKRVSTAMQTVSILDHSDDAPVSANRQRSAFPPNFIHSLDSTHMLMTALDCRDRGLHFVSVHDSFWTHACDVDEMNYSLRDMFVMLYTQPILENLRDQLQRRFPTVDIPPVPEKGTLDIQEVREAEYFFN